MATPWLWPLDLACLLKDNFFESTNQAVLSFGDFVSEHSASQTHIRGQGWEADW